MNRVTPPLHAQIKTHITSDAANALPVTIAFERACKENLVVVNLAKSLFELNNAVESAKN